MSQATSNTWAYLDPRTLAAVAPLDLRARMIVEGLMTGMHRSPYQGFSVEFAQHRAYAPGDDTRFLDWKVFGRTDKLYIKQYQKETNLDLVLLVDCSGSMGYSSAGAPVLGARAKRGRGSAKASGSGNTSIGIRGWRKYDHAATLAAAMAYLALKQQDRVGLTLFAQEVRTATRLSNSQGHWRSIVEALGSVQPQVEPRQEDVRSEVPGRTDLAGLFDRVAAKLARRSLIVLVSDLLDDPAVIERGLAQLHHRRHDLIVAQVLDPAELAFPFRSPSEFIGLEAEGKLPMDPAALREAYLSALRQQLRQIEQAARRFHFDYLLLDSSRPLGPPLSHFLARRTASIGRG